MGTRGFVGWAVDGKATTSYVQYDSYPSQLGVQTLRALRAFEDLDSLKGTFLNIKQVDEAEDFTEEDKQRWGQYWENVSSGTDYYSLLRKLQGDVFGMIEAGIVTVADENWPLNSLFCEWGYLINLDTNLLEVYKGFQHGEVKGFWHGQQEAGNGYAPVSLIGCFDLDELPSEEEFLAVVDQEEVED